VPAGPGGLGEQRREPLHPAVDGDVVDSTPRSARSSSTSRNDRPKRRYQRTASTITSGGKQKPAKADRGTVAGRGRRVLMTTVCLLRARSQHMQQCHQKTRRGRVWVPRRFRERPQVELRHGRDPQGLRGSRRDDLPAGPLGSEAQPRELRGRRVRPPRHLEIRGQLGPFPSRLSYALEATPQGTRVTNAVELELRGPGRLLGRVAVPRVWEAVAANLSKLKELLDR
jgi:hypothetical protein